MTSKETQVRNTDHHPREGEIDIVSMASTLFRWRWLIAGLVLTATLMSLAFDYFQTAVYKYGVTISIGKVRDQTKNDQYIFFQMSDIKTPTVETLVQRRGEKYIESPQDAAVRLREIAHSVYRREFIDKHVEPSFTVKKDFDAWPSFDSAIIQAELTATRSGELSGNNVAADFLRLTAETLVDEHNRFANSHSQNLREEAARLEKQLERKNKLLRDIEDQLDTLRVKQENIEKRVGELKQRVNDLQKTKSLYDENQSRDYVDLLQFDNALYQTRSHLDEMSTLLFVTVPEKKHQLRMAMDEIETQTDGIRESLETARNKADDTFETKIVSDPEFKGSRIPPRYALHAVLSTVLGGVLGIFVAFIIEFWVNNRARVVTPNSN